jgi:SAM-dependent methyltransferase
MNPHLDFGYPWWLSYGHLAVTAFALLLLVAAVAFRWPRLAAALIAALALWSVAAFAVARFAFNVNGRLPLPTGRFLAGGSGRVLDMGAGTGRSSIMVLEARPQASVVALDLFAESYQEHFGPGQSGQERLLANLRAAGVANRAAIQAGDMRKLPFEPAAFDGIVSTYAIDHLNREGTDQALREASRVLKPGGEFLMMVITKDFWLKFTFGPLLLHSGTRGQEWWTTHLRDAGFEMLEQGTRPGTFYFLARRP